LRALRATLGPDADPRERVQLGERLLGVLESDEAAALGREVAAAWAELGDAEAELRVLEAAIERAPADAEVRGRLEARYRERGDSHGLVRILTASAERVKEPSTKAALLREAAVLRRDKLADARGAVELLRQARDLDPDDQPLLVELAAATAAAGDPPGALALLGDAIDKAAAAAAKVSLLRARASVRATIDDDEGALSDLEAAYAVDPSGVADELVAARDESARPTTSRR
jgi:tetratricopeptide (TPR) repeat protein